MKTTVKKIFMDIHKEEEWLNQQGENGLMLLGCHGSVYEFENVAPARYQYKIDLPDYTGKQKNAYLVFIEQCGISIVCQNAGKIYLRKNDADGPLELYTENKEIKKQMNKRFSHFIGIGASQLGLGTMLLIGMTNYMTTKGAPFWINAVFGGLFLLSGIAFIATGVVRNKKNTIKQKDTNIWE